MVRVRFASFAVLTLWLLLPGADAVMCRPGGTARPGAAAPLTSRVSCVPHLGLRADESIDAFDFAIDDSGALHFAWAATRSDSGSQRRRRSEIWYCRGDRGGASWTRPLRLGPAQGAGPRVVIAGGALHVFSGWDLKHWASGDRGDSWSVLPALRDGPRWGARSFDIHAMNDDSLLVAFIGVGVDSPGEPPVPGSALYVLTWSGLGASQPHRLVRVAGAPVFLPAPRIASDGDRIHVFAGFNELFTRVETVNGRSCEVTKQRGRLFHAVCSAQGVPADWGAAQELPLPRRHGESLGDLAVLSSEDQVALFFCAYSVYRTELAPDGKWSRAVPLTPEREPFIGSYASSSVGVARVGCQARLVWIDERHRKSDRSPWNPLGGFPWSDSPEWCNNDVFTTRLPTAPTSPVIPGSPRAERLTQPLSQACGAIIHAVGERFCVAWNGRAKVGRTPADRGASPQLFFTYLP